MAQAPQVPLGVDPEVPAPARMCDYFLGGSQNFDTGSGLPAVGNTHEVVQQIRPGARVVYVDHDPLVIAHSSGLLTDPATVRARRPPPRSCTPVNGAPAIPRWPIPADPTGCTAALAAVPETMPAEEMRWQR